MKKLTDKDTAHGRWRAAEEKLARLLQADAGPGTEGLTEEELSIVSARRFDKADAETRRALVRLALRLRSPLTAKTLVAKASSNLDLDTLASLAELIDLAGDAPPWLARVPGLRKEIEETVASVRADSESAGQVRASQFVSLPAALRGPALRSLIREGGETMVPLAREIARQDPGIVVQVADAMASVASESVGALLLDLLRGTEDKQVVKSLRRAIQRLRQVGIKVEMPREGEPVFRPTERAKPEAHVTGIDAHGARLVFLVQPRLPHGLHLFEALVTDERGLVEFRAYETHRRGVDRFLDALRDQGPLLLTATEPSHARWIMAEAMERNVRSGTRLPAGASELRPLWDAGEEAAAPAQEAASRVADAEAGSALASCANLLEHESFKGWYVDPDLLNPALEKLKDAASSKIVLAPLQKKERLAAVVREATDQIFAAGGPDSLRARYARRLSEMTHIFSLRDEAALARQARGAADHLANPDSRPSLNPLAYALVEKTLTILSRDEEERQKKVAEGADASLVMKP